MASREKRPLAPSKSKQKANNNDSGVPSSPTKSKKGKTLPAYILEAVATGSSKLSPKLESALPRKKVIAGLKCNKKLRATKGNLLKVNSTKTVPVKNLKRLTTQGSAKASKSLLNRAKKVKPVTAKPAADSDSVPSNESTLKVGLKSTKKLKTLTDTTAVKSPKGAKIAGRRTVNAKEGYDLVAVHNYLYGKNPSDTTKNPKSANVLASTKTSIDLTIDEVLAQSSDTEMEVDAEKGKLTRSRRTLLAENDIKKEIIDGEELEKSDDDVETSPEGQSTAAAQTRKRTNQRSLRNGKLRQLDLTLDLDKKSRKLVAEETATSANVSETCGAVSPVVTALNEADPTNTLAKAEEEQSDEVLDISSEVENNNNSERVGGGSEVGPMLRSKTKAKSTDTAIKIDDSDVEEEDDAEVIMVKRVEDSKKLSLDQLRKDCLLGKVASDRQQPTKRRSSLNIDVKKTMGSLYGGSEKGDSSTAPKSQIDQMIENIKLTIAKSIESKIYRPDKALGIGKSFEVSKIEEIVAPLSTETHEKINLEEVKNTSNKPSDSTSETDSPNCSGDADNSVPKVADTAKEIEKLVMGDIESTVDKSVEAVEAKTSKEPAPSVSDDFTVSLTDDATSQPRPESPLPSQSCSKANDKHESDMPRLEVGVESPGPAIQHESMDIDDLETLETISQEVERLVTEPVDTECKISTPEVNNLIVAIKPTESHSDDAPPVEKIDCLSDTSPEEKNELAATDSSAEISTNPPEKSESTVVTKESESLESNSPLETEENTTTVEGDSSTLDQQNCLTVTAPEVSPKLDEKPKDSLAEIPAQPEKSGKTSPEKATVSHEVSKIKEEKPASKETKCIVEESRRVLRARDKQKKTTDKSPPKASDVIESIVKIEPDASRIDITSESCTDSPEPPVVIKVEEPEPQTRTRRSRDMRKRKEETSPPQSSLKSKRNRRETKKTEQQNKEETLLDNEVAKINENKRSFSADKFAKRLEGIESLREFSENSRNSRDKADNRSKSENDLDSSKDKRLSRGRYDTEEPKDPENPENSDIDTSSKVKTPENLQKDSDEASTSGESTSSASTKILETPEDKERKESILRLLGLESMEKAAERLQKAKREQYSSGTLKTVIRVQKDKKRSRSPLKLVFNRQGRTDGEGVSPEFYTIQKELGSSGLGDSSSGANRKFSTNHRQSCDEDNEETPSKDRQSLIIPEKSSSFSIHPGRLCADVCCYCFGKFGSLDTPMHLAQLKSDERRKKILSVERHLTKDSCLCDACYRHVDRKANASPTNTGPKPQRVHRQLLVSKCSVKDCRNPARHLIKRRWLHKIKACVQNRVNFDINWEPSQHTSMSFCVDHYAIIEKFLTCSLCTRRLARNATRTLNAQETAELNRLLEQQGIPIPLQPGTHVCKLCRYFSQVQLKYKDVENMNANHRSFSKSYRKRILHYNEIEVMDNEEDDESSQSMSSKDKRKKAKSTQNKNLPSKLPEDDALTSEKSSSDISKQVPASSEITEQEKVPEPVEELAPSTDTPILDLESTVEKLKKRKALDQHLYATDTPIFPNNNSSSTSSGGSGDGGGSGGGAGGGGGNAGADVVEILAMDKEVTLTRLPKRPRLSNDITPVVQRLGANPSISVRTLFPGEEEMGLHANIEFSNVREVTPQGWEKCATIIQYDRDTKSLWQDLQRPYGNQSSFLRHLILLEKYYRSGDLVLAPNASRNAINYSTSVQNRLISYEGPEKMDEPIVGYVGYEKMEKTTNNESVPTEFANSRRLSGGFVMERDRLSVPSTSAIMASAATATSTPIKTIANPSNIKSTGTKILKLTPGVSIIKKPPPSLQRLNLPLASGGSSGGGGGGGGGGGSVASTNGSSKRKDAYPSKLSGSTSGGKVFHLTEPDYKRLQSLKKQKMLNEKMNTTTATTSVSTAVSNIKANLQLQKTHMAQQTQFQKHLRMQQEMLNRQSRGDFEPLICDVRSLANENTPAQNLLNNLNLPKSIQVTTKPSSTNPIPILPKIPKSLTVIPQTIPRSVDK